MGEIEELKEYIARMGDAHHKLTLENNELRNQIHEIGTNEGIKRQLRRFSFLQMCIGKALKAIWANDLDEAIKLLGKGLRLDEEDVDAFIQGAYENRNGSHPNGMHARIYPRRGQKRKNISLRRREAIFERDDHTCLGCGSKENLTIDHIIPLSFGGTNQDGNLQTLCEDCNRNKQRKLNEAPIEGPYNEETIKIFLARRRAT